jgi:hypothetical protein
MVRRCCAFRTLADGREWTVVSEVRSSYRPKGCSAWWWLSVGMVLVVQALTFGILGVVPFIVVHWLCDLVWLWVLSALSFQGADRFGPRFQVGSLAVCGIALLGFGLKFVVDAVRTIAS